MDRIYQILKDEYPNFEVPQIFEVLIADVLDMSKLEELFTKRIEEKCPITTVVHLAAKKAVGESVKFPLMYYENNFVGTLNVLKCMEKYNCKRFIFSSTATVYGCNDKCREDSPINPLHPYSSTKVCMEYVLRDFANSKPDYQIIALRYFNPAGAHPSGLIGDSPSVFPNNLFPFIEQVIIGKRPLLTIFGNDYKTHDGTGIRDYIHIVDLAKAHVVALEKLQTTKGFDVFNLGTAKGYSVFDIITSYSRVIGKEIPYKIGERRLGDVDVLICVCDKANKEFNWKVEKSLEDMCRDSFNFIQKNPEGIQ